MATPTSDSFKPVLKRLVETPEFFRPDDLRLAFDHLFAPNVLLPEQIGAFLTALHIHGIEKRPELLVAAASYFLERSHNVFVQDEQNDFIVDIVGTGGDGHNLFNVSTTAGVVAAGAGARVIKHGNQASTSLTGSADILKSMGCVFVPPTSTQGIIPRIPFTFILAGHYHPTLASIAPYRKVLPFRTIFNEIGPLINPVRPRGMILGVASPELGLPFAKSLLDRGVDRALVVCGQERLDEISCSGPTWAWELKEGHITELTLTPEMFGVEVHPLSSVVGGNPQQNARTFETLLTSGNDIPVNLIPVLDFVLVNASALLVIAGVAKDYREGTRLALESVVSGKAWSALDTFRRTSQDLLNSDV